jgi:uncharacterized membrane protein YbaN (DUF454 family)
MSIDSPFQTSRASLSDRASAIAEACVQAAYLAVGVVLAVFGTVAIVLPFIPATTTLLAASVFLSRRYPRAFREPNAYRGLGHRRRAGSLYTYLARATRLSRRSRIGFGIGMWLNLLVTCVCLHGIGLANYPIVSLNVFCCLLSTIYLLRSGAADAVVTQVIDVDRRNSLHSTTAEYHLLEDVQYLSNEATEALSEGRTAAPTRGSKQLPNTAGGRLSHPH